MIQDEISNVTGALRWRYATKSFDASKKLPPEVLDALLESLVLSPSSFGLQPWRFIVVEDPALRTRLRAESWDQSQVTDASHFIVLTVRDTLTAADIDECLERVGEVRGGSTESLAPLRNMILGFIATKNDEEKFVWNSRQAYIALGQLMTCAALLGVDACPLEGISPAGYDAVLDLADSGYRTVVACALGYRSAADPYAVASKVRYPRERVVTVR
jgi:nitroreductase